MSDQLNKLIDIHNQTNAEQQTCIDNLKKTIKGLDRATVEYTRIITEKDKTIDTLTNVNQAHSAMLKLKHNEVSELEQRIATLLEAQASVPIRDVNGTIEALHGLVAKLKGDVLKLQAKVTEQEDTITNLKDDEYQRFLTEQENS
jgi:prefoldin subunit 5